MRIATPAGQTGMAYWLVYWLQAIRHAGGRPQNSGSQSTVIVPDSKSTDFT